MNQHHFKLALEWNKSDINKNSDRRIYKKSHTIQVTGKELLHVSAAKIFKGDPNLLNPEDLLLSSLTSCHMMSFLYCCEINKIDVISYTDNSEAILEVNSNGSGKIVKVILAPKVEIADKTKIILANSLHNQANKLCFIANSCNFPVEHHSICF